MTPHKQERQNLFAARKEEVGDYLKAARTAKNIGVRSLAAMSGISLSTIRNVERGRAEVRLETLQKIVDTLEAL
jgi:transcriptional regulator with XRE-family HTH domain